MENFKKLFDSISGLKVGIIGDMMLDTYMWGKVDRISPEAPVPVVTLQKKDNRIGGAGNVALNCRSLGANVSVFSVIGNDDEGRQLEKLLNEALIDTTGIIKSNKRITTNKIRIISRNQQMLRLDNEMILDLGAEEEEMLLKNINDFIIRDDPDVIVFEDYNKGILTEKVISSAIRLCREAGIISAVDPKRKNFFSYKGVEIFKPNLHEVKESLNLLFDDVNERVLQNIHKELSNFLHHKISFITLSEKGVFYQEGNRKKIIPSHIRNIADVSGAGDTVIAVASVVYAASGNVHLMAEIANIAGGIVCEEVGTVAVSKDKLLHECELLLS
jgi:rfaE bifunctional protein kinase chain/domain